MYKAEMDRFNKKIDEEKITQRSKKALHDLVEDFFSMNYQNISKKGRRVIELRFELKYNKSIARIDKIDFDNDKAIRILEQIETSLFTILDKSVRKSIWEKILSSILREIHFHYHK